MNSTDCLIDCNRFKLLIRNETLIAILLLLFLSFSTNLCQARDETFFYYSFLNWTQTKLKTRPCTLPVEQLVIFSITFFSSTRSTLSRSVSCFSFSIPSPSSHSSRAALRWRFLLFFLKLLLGFFLDSQWIINYELRDMFFTFIHNRCSRPSIN